MPFIPRATALLVRRWDALADSQASQKAGVTANLSVIDPRHDIIAPENTSLLMSILETSLKQNARTTVSIPIELLQNVDEVIRSGRFTSRNDFFATAIRRELERMQREVIDRQFAGMAEDSIYQNEGRHISKEYEYADWEALRVAERDS